MAGTTTVAYEGALDYPGNDAAWAIVEELRVEGLFTSPTGVRLLMRYGTGEARKHDLSTVRRMDELIILEHGRVVERGTHGALLAGSGIYASLWSHQSGGFLGDGAAENEQGERT